MKTDKQRQPLVSLFPFLVTAAVALGLGGFQTAAAQVVAPPAQETTEGSTNLTFPFGRTNASNRLQQVYNSTLFGSLNGPQFITSLAFRPDVQVANGYSVTFTNVQINLTTTSRTETTLSSTYANNLGSDNTVVYDGSLTLSTANTGPSGGPKAFDLLINLETPFRYDPSQGSLLLDVRVFNPAPTGFDARLDAHFAAGDGVASVFGDNVNSVSNGAATTGLVTRFNFSPVPEPGTASLLAIGLLPLAVIVLRRRIEARKQGECYERTNS